MTNEPPRIVRLPSEDQIAVAFTNYALALGRAAYAWNFLLDQMGALFVVVVGDAERDTLLAMQAT